MMSKFAHTTRLALYGLVAAICVQAASAQAETVFRFNMWLPKFHPMVVKLIKPLGEQFAQRTDGRVKIKLTAASLGPPPKQFDMVVGGIADLVFTNHGYTPGQFPLTGIIGLPFLGDKAEALSVAYWRVHEKHFAAVGEHTRVKLIGLSTHGGGPIFSQKPIARVADLAGLKMIATNGTLVKMARRLGVAPVMATPPKWFELMSRGVVDGGLISTDAPPKFKITKFVPYYTIIPGGLYNSSFPVMMNLKKWNKLSSKDRQALEPLFGEPLSRKAGHIWDVGEAWARGQFSKVGIKTSTADATFINELRGKLSGFVAAWIDRAKQKGVDGDAALKMLRAETAKEEAKL